MPQLEINKCKIQKGNTVLNGIIIDKILSENNNISKVVANKIIKSFFDKSIDRLIEGKLIHFKHLGCPRIYKYQYKLSNYFINKYKSVDKALHGYFYNIQFDHSTVYKKIGVTFEIDEKTDNYIKKNAIDRNLDFTMKKAHVSKFI